MLTREPAELYALRDRGLLAPGMKADGIEATLVSGEVIYRQGEATGALPGKLVRGSQEPDQTTV